MQPGWLKEFWRKQEEAAVPEESTQEARPEAVSRRSFVKGGVVGGVAAGMAAGQVVAQAQAQPAAANPLSAGNWWPSPWGAQDQRGANNRITPAKVVEAARLIKTGKIYPLGRVLEKGIPLFGERLGPHIVIPGSPTGGPFGNHKLHYHDELFVGEIGQAGSQFDGLGHIGMVASDGKLRYYNGLTQEEVGGTYGLQKLGVEHCRPFFTRGILLDVLALKGGDRLPIDYVITVADIEVGTQLGGLVAEPGRWGLDFAFPAVFLALVAGQLRGRADWLVAGASAVVAVGIGFVLPGNWHIVIAGVAVSAAAALVLQPEPA